MTLPRGIAQPTELIKQLNALAANWEHNPKSGLYLMWAGLGAGRTHALRYLQGLTEATKPPGLAIYCDIPEATGDFKGVYVQAVSRIPEGLVATVINLGDDHRPAELQIIVNRIVVSMR